MTKSEYIADLEKTILLLRTQIKHLSNDLRLTKEEYEKSTNDFFDIYSHMEKKVEDRTGEVKKLQRVLEVKGKELQIMLDLSQTMIFYRDREQRYIRVNRKFSEALGIPITEIIGKTNAELFHEDKGSILEDDLEVIQKGNQVLNRTGDIETPRGKRQILVDKVPHKDIDGNVIGLIGFALDVTDIKKADAQRKDLEQKLANAKKMEALGTLAGGVAHDLNNVLGAIVGYPDLLLLNIPEDSSFKKPLLTMKKSGEKAAAIVQDLLTLARRGVNTRDVVNLNSVISDFLKNSEYEKLREYHHSVEFEIALETDLLNIIGSPVHLYKTVLNLLSNAAEAMPEGGKIIVRTENMCLDKTINGYESIREGDYVVLTVSDNGTGISRESLEKIFEPFYTKKVMGRSGTGLGMAVVWGTIKDHNGYIDVQSVEGKGTTFTLYFPITRKELAKDGHHLPIEDYMGKGESILVVDDVKDQREIAAQILNSLGYSVTTVSSGEEAVEYMQTNGVDLLMLDMIMDPGIDGLETFKRIIESHPKQKAIIVSGFSETDRVQEARRLGAGEYVKKPYILERIGIALRTAFLDQ
jgi:PAS domain S-box-containing protein